MAFKKKETYETISQKIDDLKAGEQTPETMKEVDELTTKLEDFTPVSKSSHSKGIVEIPKSKKDGPAFTHEEWRLEKKIVDQKIQLSRLKMLKKVIITDEHEGILNEQKANTLLEYVKI